VQEKKLPEKLFLYFIFQADVEQCTTLIKKDFASRSSSLAVVFSLNLSNGRSNGSDERGSNAWQNQMIEAFSTFYLRVCLEFVLAS
jgi:hypothetical protein